MNEIVLTVIINKNKYDFHVDGSLEFSKIEEGFENAIVLINRVPILIQNIRNENAKSSIRE